MTTLERELLNALKETVNDLNFYSFEVTVGFTAERALEARKRIKELLPRYESVIAKAEKE